jgi:hypothetical protein
MGGSTSQHIGTDIYQDPQKMDAYSVTLVFSVLPDDVLGIVQN